VLNVSNIGFTFGEQVSGMRRHFDWTGVRRAIEFYEALGYFPVCLCKAATAVHNPVPADLAQQVTVCPVDDRFPGNDDLFAMRAAILWKCSLVDNDNFRDWRLWRD
jgi:hypothetical protein